MKRRCRRRIFSVGLAGHGANGFLACTGDSIHMARRKATKKTTKKAAGLTREEAIADLIRRMAEAQEKGDDNIELAIRKELHRLLGFYQAPEPVEESEVESATLAAIREHLEPLGLAPAGTDIVELVRLAAIRITEK